MSSDLQDQLSEAENSFKKACEQIIHLNRRLDEMAKRYDKASRENHRSFRYSLRLRMAVSEGVRNMYYEYAANKADLISELRFKVADSTGLRSVVDDAGLATEGNVNLPHADRVEEGERRERESTHDSGTRTASLENTQVMDTKTPSEGSTDQSATQGAENEEELDEEDPLASLNLVPVEGIPVGQYDSSDMDSPGAGSSGWSSSSSTVVNEATEDSELVESYLTSDHVENSESVRTASSSPVSNH